MTADNDPEETPDDLLNAVTNPLRDVLDGLTVVELFAGTGKVSRRFLHEGAARAVCVDHDPPETRHEADGMIWLPMDVLEFLGEERVQDVGLVYSAPPPGSDLNTEVLHHLKRATILVDSCLVLLEEPTWHQTRLEEFPRFPVFDSYQSDDTKITVTQMRDPMAPGPD